MDNATFIQYLQSVKALLNKVLSVLQSMQGTTKTAEVLQNEFGLSKEASEKLAQSLVSAKDLTEALKILKEETKEDFVTMKVASPQIKTTSEIEDPRQDLLEWLYN